MHSSNYFPTRFPSNALKSHWNHVETARSPVIVHSFHATESRNTRKSSTQLLEALAKFLYVTYVSRPGNGVNTEILRSFLSRQKPFCILISAPSNCRGGCNARTPTSLNIRIPAWFIDGLCYQGILRATRPRAEVVPTLLHDEWDRYLRQPNVRRVRKSLLNGGAATRRQVKY